MYRHAYLATAAIAAVAAAVTTLAPAPAIATTAPSHVTVTASTTTPASGQVFHLSGAVWSGGERKPATIHVKTWRNGTWVQLSGAVEHTNRHRRYDIRVILQMKGQRELRVVGVPDASAIAPSHHDLTVTVH